MHLQPLGGEWQVSKTGGDEWFPANVPGCIHVDLLDAGVIPDPFDEDNERRMAWIAETDWTYRLAFEPDAELLAEDHTFLECEGLDTLATVKLNGEVIARTDNMFRIYRFDVTGKIISDVNTIEIALDSPVNFARGNLLSDPLVVSPSESIPGSPCLRKAMYQWGWDWAPKLPTSGIWRPIRFAGYSKAKIDELQTHQRHADGHVELELVVKAVRFSDCEITAHARLTFPSGESMEQRERIGDDSQTRLTFSLQHPELWWPNGYGQQPLYQLQVSIEEDYPPSANRGSKSLDSKNVRIGLRTLELRQEKDEWGRSFAFVVNGVPIFCKGANWVPADQFPSRVTEDQYQDLIVSATFANMNMLRVWGGGIYEDDRFYDLCDEFGILIWQDFMFSCAQYPVHQEMFENIRTEAIENVRRIRHHPCLALWCGNNEMEWGVTDWWPDHQFERRQNYAEIFHKLLAEICAVEAPDTSYWPSSPSSGGAFEDPNSENEGDRHYWDVWHGRKPLAEYRKQFPRFTSEFGFESLPSIETVKTFARLKDWNMNSYIMDSHQKCLAGNELLLHYTARNFRMPNGFSMWSYVSQVLQGEAMRCGVEHWRRNRNDNRCMGALYWMSNDCWPGTSWSGMEYNHRWKALHYFARRFYAPVLISVEDLSSEASNNEEFVGRVRLHVTNDRPTPFHGGVRWSLERLNGTGIVSREFQVTLPALTSFCVADLDFSQWIDDRTRMESALIYSIWEDNHRLAISMASFVPNRYLQLSDPATVYEVEERDDGIYIILVAMNSARFVMLAVPGLDLRFSDNYLDLPAGRLVTVRVEDAAGLSVKEISSRLKVTSLWDSYQADRRG